MFCYQCEQTVKGQGCTVAGVCGKDAQTSDLQDLLIHAVKGISVYAEKAAASGNRNREIADFVIQSLFTTVTNVNFDPARIEKLIRKAAEMRNQARKMYQDACRKTGKQEDKFAGAASFEPASDLAGLLSQARKVALDNDVEKYGPTVAGLYHLVLYGIKGVAAYADHARILGQQQDSVDDFFYQVMAFLNRDNDVDSLVGMALKVGEVNIRVMEMLDAANTEKYGHPVPTKVRVTPVKGKAILVSGHDLKDLEELLIQTQGKGINIYTHGEMLPCHGYPELKKYPHLVGNYGGAWQDQQKEFDEFPGSILMTTNCIQKPKDTYKNRIFTTGLVAFPGVTHVENGKFAAVIESALNNKGFTEDTPEKTIMVGFGRNAVLGVADKVIDAVKAGKIRRFFLVGGCDGAKSGRNYYTDLAQKIPQDCVILTLACGKYRFNKLEFGDIGGIPRLLDIGQCNDAYSAVKIALALAEAFNTDVNSLPLSMILSWYEQKAVCILLSLLHLGIRKIKLGPTLPAFVKPEVLQVLVDKYQIAPTTTACDDLKEILGDNCCQGNC